MSRPLRRVLCLMLCLCLLPAAALGERYGLSPRNPQVLTLWHYYNGMQQQIFDELVLQFNETVGNELGIVIEAMSQGSVNNLSSKLLAAARGDAGSDPMPDICGAYADTAYDVDQMGLVADLAPYFTQEELDAYISAYIHEGQLDTAGTLKLFPIAKSTEVLMLNKTAWDPFAAETGVTLSQLTTWEGICEVAARYWDWTDAQTGALWDGQAFFGRDAVANYMVIGSMQLGREIFSVHNGEMILTLDRDVMRRLWDNYAVPFISGHFAAYGRFRSDDVKTGLLISLVGSTSGALYFPREVTRDDGTTYPIECLVLPLPGFAGTEPYAPQQGAGMNVRNSTPDRIYAATVFLKWITQPEHNIAFSLQSGYLPVTTEACSGTLLEDTMDAMQVSDLLRAVIGTGVEMTGAYTLYTNNAFARGNEARAVLENSLPDWISDAIAQRDELLAGGADRDEVLQRLTGDEAFDAWYESLCLDMQEALGR